MTKSRPVLIPRMLLVMSLIYVCTTIDSQTVSNRYFTISFNKTRGTLSAHRADGSVLFTDCVNAISSEGKIYTSDRRNYSYRSEISAKKGGQTELLIRGRDKKRKLDFINRITLSKDKPALVLEVIYQNVSQTDIGAGSIIPLRLTGTKGDFLFFRNAKKCMTGGAMYYDAGMIHDLDKEYVKPEPYGDTKGGVCHDSVLYKNSPPVESWWNIAVFRGYKDESLLAGYLSSNNSLGRIMLKKDNDAQLSIVAESVFSPGFILGKSEQISSDKFAIILNNDPYSSLDLYASLMSEEITKPAPSVVNGWCNWFYTMDSFDENEILLNARFAAQELKPYGLEYIQIDEGFQNSHGDWQGNSRFPHGLKWLCKKIKDLGLRPGIWIAPFVISENSAVFREHPEWLIRDDNGNPLRIGPWPSVNTDWYRDENPKRYCLDISQPGAEKWYTDLIDTIANNWGFEMIKVDFVAWTIFSAPSFYNKSATPASLYRKAMEIMRKTAGDECHILDCGPGFVTAGYINSMRVEYDQYYGFSDAAWRQYFIGSSSSAGAAGKRFLYHNKLWVNDIDHICIDLLPLENARAAATLVGLSGGNIMSGDRLPNLSPSKIEILKKVYPATIENAVPVDLLDNDPQTNFKCHIERECGKWDIAAFFNPDLNKQITLRYEAKRLGLDSIKTYLAFDFWNEKFAGEVKDTMTISVNPGSVQLYSLHEKTEYPQIISTNRHIKQGAVELENVHYDIDKGILSARSLSPAGSSHSVYVYVPDKYTWSPDDSKIFEYHSNYTVRKTGEHILRVDVFFDKTDYIDWILTFRVSE